MLANRTTAFFVAGMAALTLVGAGSWLWGQRMGTTRAIEEVRGRTEALGAQVLGADVVTGLLTDDPLARERVDRLIDGHATELLGVTLWTTDGDALYSRSKAPSGAPEPLDAMALEALQTRTPSTALRTSSDPSDTVLRVHQPLPRPEGDVLLLRADYDYEVVSANGLRVWRAFAPVTLGALVAMAALWMVLAALAGRRSRAAWDVGDAPVPEAAQAARREPVPWADEPDGRTQAFNPQVHTSPARVAEPASNGAAGRSAPRPPAAPAEDDGGWLGTVEGGTPWPAVPFTQPVPEDEVPLPGALRDGCPRPVRQPALAGLKTFSSQAPAPVRNGSREAIGHANGKGHTANGNGQAPERRRTLETALSGMLTPLARQGIDIRLDLPPGLRLPGAIEELLIRAAEEAVRNAVSHAEARTVKVRLDLRDQRVELTIDDDGRGFDPSDLTALPGERRHLGLRTLTRLAAEAGGSLHVRSSPDRGTRLHLDLPAV